MPGESPLHAALVVRLVAHVRRRHQAPRGLLVLADHVDFGRNRPATVGGFLPDVFASDLPATFEILGEAKTLGDLESPRSARQITAFLDHLSFRADAWFYLAVPPLAKARGAALLKNLSRPHHRTVHVEVVDGL